MTTQEKQSLSQKRSKASRRSWTFLSEYLRRPGTIGAIAPSSRHLAEEIVSQADVANAQVIVEFGAGTGSFTKVILQQKAAKSSFYAIEQNDRLCTILRHRFPEAHIITDSVENAGKILTANYHIHACSIVSGLPWASFSEDLQDRILDGTLKALRPGGRFVSFMYLQSLILPASQRFRKKIQALFSTVKTSRIVWRNLPPAFIYCCTK
ncbi:MAG: hypothetical protein JXA82_16820 [Sedimentisphaerales bacterium]|nr:hypothetical protein [Sedimentisphaerales bacterium]